MDSQDLPLKLHEAIRFAEEKHRAQKRKGTDIAYIIHPMEVLQILMGERCSIEVAIAGVLHDVLEDTDADADEIRAVVTGVLADLGIASATAKDKGRIMKELMPKVKGKADGKLVNEIVTSFMN